MGEKLTIEDFKRLMEKSYTLYDLQHDENLVGHELVLQKCLEEHNDLPLADLIESHYFDKIYLKASDQLDKLADKVVKELDFDTESVIAFVADPDVRDTLMIEILDRQRTPIEKAFIYQTPALPVRIEVEVPFSTNPSNRIPYLSQAGVLSLLSLNPKDIQDLLAEQGIHTDGEWPDIPSNAIVHPEDFVQELIDFREGMKFTFATQIDVLELNGDHFRVAQVTLPQGTPCGFYCGEYGSHSSFGMITEQELRVDLSDLGSPRMVFDKAEGHSLSECLGLTRNDLFKSNVLTINDRFPDPHVEAKTQKRRSSCSCRFVKF